MPGPKNILIAEGDRDEAASIKRLLLAGGGERVCVVENMAAVPAALEKDKAELLLLTLESEGIAEQLKAARELQQRTSLAIVFVVDATACVELTKIGGVPPSGYVVKPVDGRELWVVIDAVARMRKIEQRLHRLESRLRDVQRLESIGVVAGWIAHDFNNLITGIYGAVAIASGELPEDSPARQRLDHIERAATRAAELCQRLMVPPGSSSGARIPVSLSEIAEEAVRLVQDGVRSGVVIQTGFTAGLPTVQAVEAQVRQAVINLVTNSVEAITNSSGMVRIVTYARRLDERALASVTLPGEAQAGEYVVLEVTDTGCGMEKSLLGRIFDPQYSTKGSNRGLGLAAVARILRKHGGAIDVDSSPG